MLGVLLPWHPRKESGNGAVSAMLPRRFISRFNIQLGRPQTATIDAPFSYIVKQYVQKSWEALGQFELICPQSGVSLCHELTFFFPPKCRAWSIPPRIHSALRKTEQQGIQRVAIFAPSTPTSHSARFLSGSGESGIPGSPPREDSQLSAEW